MVDDYLDVFGDETVLRRPRFDDSREGKITAPVISLLSPFRIRAARRMSTWSLAELSGREPLPATGNGYSNLMREHNVADTLRKQISERAAHLAEPAHPPGPQRPCWRLCAACRTDYRFQHATIDRT